MNVLRRSIFSNLSIYLKKNQDRGYLDLSLFEVGPIFFGKNPGEQRIVIGGMRSGKVGRKSWLEKERKVDVFDIKSDVILSLMELGVEEKNIFVNENSTSSFHPGRSGTITFKSEKGPLLAHFGEIHPAIIKKIDFKEPNIYGFEIFINNITQPDNKLRLSKKNLKSSDFQKSERDFAFVLDKIIKIGVLEKLIREIDEKIIKQVNTFDIYEGDKIPKGKKSVAINVVLQSDEKTLNEKDLDSICKKIIEVVRDKTGATIRS